MKFKLCIILLSLLASVSLISAQTTADTPKIIKDIDEAGNITLILPANMSRCLTQREVTPATETENTESAPVSNASDRATAKVGYRVQVFDDNNVMTAKHDAQSRKQQIESRFPEFRTYVQFNSPYWKVKVGDFRTRSEADAAMAAIRAAFPAFATQLRVVRDRIHP